MKHTAKFLAVLLALATVMAFGLTFASAQVAQAPRNDGKIIIGGAIEGQTYHAYRILDIESISDDNEAFVYVTNDKWREFIDAHSDFIKVDADNYASWNDDADEAADVTNRTAARAAEFAKEIKKWLETHIDYDDPNMTDRGIPSDGTVTATADGAEFTGLPLGYYFIDTSLGTICSLDTTVTVNTAGLHEVTIYEKNEVPSILKEVAEGEDANGNPKYGKHNDAQIGDVVKFKSTISIPKRVGGAAEDEPHYGTDPNKVPYYDDDKLSPPNSGAQKYWVEDTLGPGLTFESITKVTIEHVAEELPETDVAATNYDLDRRDDQFFTVRFHQDWLDTETYPEDKIAIYYTAKVNEKAVINGDGNPNDVKLRYGYKDEPGKPTGVDPSYGTDATKDTRTKTYVWDIRLEKFTYGSDKKIDPPKALDDATFELVKVTNDQTHPTKLIKLIRVNDEHYRVDMVNGQDTFITTDTGKIHITGLDSGSYRFNEKIAPKGYNKITSPIPFTITDPNAYSILPEASVDHADYTGTSASVLSPNDPNEVVAVENKTGAILPATGGTGTKVLVTVCSLLVIVAGVLLVTKKKMSAFCG